MKLSVVIPYHRAAGTIAGQLEALASQKWTEPWEVVISDNEGSHELTEIVDAFADRMALRVVDSSTRRGSGYARNVGVRAASGDMIAFCDADDEIGAGWLPAIGDALSRHDFVACRSDLSKLNPEWIQELFADDPQQFGLDRLAFPPFLPFAGGGSLGIRRSVHDRVGGFDESWPILQDVDYCIRVQLTGTELRYVPEALVHYRYRAMVPDLFDRARRWGKYYVRLYKRYRSEGIRAPSSWKWQITQIDHLFRNRSQARSLSTAERAAWFVHLGWNVGLLQGCVRYFCSPPPPSSAKTGLVGER